MAMETAIGIWMEYFCSCHWAVNAYIYVVMCIATSGNPTWQWEIVGDVPASHG